jgi:WD40 repeat protein
MKTKQVWEDNIVSPIQFISSPLQMITISPIQFMLCVSALVKLFLTIKVGDKVLLAVADRIFIYNAENGEVVNYVRGHKDTVYCLAYSKDGQRFASGGYIIIV